MKILNGYKSAGGKTSKACGKPIMNFSLLPWVSTVKIELKNLSVKCDKFQKKTVFFVAYVILSFFIRCVI